MNNLVYVARSSWILKFVFCFLSKQKCKNFFKKLFQVFKNLKPKKVISKQVFPAVSIDSVGKTRVSKPPVGL